MSILIFCHQLWQSQNTLQPLRGRIAGLQGRLKSLYSIHKKMVRKGVGLEEIYDARALRVVIDDGGNRQNGEAITACYQVFLYPDMPSRTQPGGALAWQQVCAALSALSLQYQGSQTHIAIYPAFPRCRSSRQRCGCGNVLPANRMTTSPTPRCALVVFSICRPARPAVPPTLADLAVRALVVNSDDSTEGMPAGVEQIPKPAHGSNRPWWCAHGDPAADVLHARRRRYERLRVRFQAPLSHCN